MNKIILMGRLTRDPEIRYGGRDITSTIANFGFAVNRKYKREGDPDADFFNCTAFGKVAEVAEKYLSRGMKILITGHIQNNNYTNKNNEKVYSVQVIVSEIEFAESKNSSNNTTAPAVPDNASDIPDSDGFINIENGIEDELPF